MSDPITNSMASLGITPDLAKSPSAGFGSRLVTSFTGVNSAVNVMVSNLTKAAKLTAQIKKDSADIAKNMKGTGSAGIGGFSNGNLGSAGGLNLGLAPVSAVTSSGNLASGVLGRGGGLGMGTFNGQKMFTVMGVTQGAMQMAGGMATAALAPAAMAYGMMPSTSDVMARNRLVFNSSLASSMGSAAYGRRVNNLFGGYTNSVLDGQQAGAIFGSYGYAAGTNVGDRLMKQAGGLGVLTGASVPSVANTLAGGMTGASMINRMRTIGVSGLSADGQSVGFQSLADQLYNRLGASNFSSATMNKNLMPGFNLSNNLEYFVQDPDMRSMMRTYFQARAKNGGKSFDLTNTKLLNSLGAGVLGADLAQRSNVGSGASAIEAYGGSISSGATAGMNTATRMQDAVNSQASSSITQGLASMKGAIEGFTGTKQGEAGLAGATLALGGFTAALQGAGGIISTLVGGRILAGLAGAGGAGATSGLGGMLAAGGVGATALTAGGAVVGGAAGLLATEGIRSYFGTNQTVGNGTGWQKAGTIAGYAGSGALAGGMIGSVVPVLGTAVGAGVGAVIGAGIGGWRAFSGGGAASGPTSGGGAGQPGSVTSYATGFVGTPYVWGGTSSNGWDCSGFVQYVYRKYGINLPRTSQEQFKKGTPVNYAEAQAGDLLFFHEPSNSQAGANHVGIYLGGGRMVAAQNHRVGTIVTAVDASHLVGVRRVLGGQNGASSNGVAGGTNNLMGGASATMMASGLLSLSSSTGGFSATSMSISQLLSTSTGASAVASSTTSTASSIGGSGSGNSSLMGILSGAGFSGKSLQTAYAIMMAESGGRSGAHNGNAGTGDNSYGLFQINMLGAMGPERLRQYHLGSNNDLFDPATNARVAYQMSHGGTKWTDWSTYKSGAYKKYLTGAPGYSQGAYRISSDQTANLHAGEMVLPASVAQSVRASMAHAAAGQSASGGGNVSITVMIAQASSSEAIRFANQVKNVLDGKASLDSIGSM